MSCIYLEINLKTVTQLGASPFKLKEYNCGLKKQSPQMQLKVYSALFKKGLEGSFISNVCPVAETEQWEECPFYKRR